MDVLTDLPAPVPASRVTRHHPVPKPRDHTRTTILAATGIGGTLLLAALTVTVGAFL